MEDRPDYRPDWRHLQVQEYLNSIYQPDAEPLTRLDGILAEESDLFVRDLLLFHCGRPCGNEEGVGYAVNFQRDNCNTLSASAIKAMVIANVSPDRIADKFGTTKEKIETFEKLYFDARRYLKHRGWLRGICFPAANRTLSSLQNCVGFPSHFAGAGLVLRKWLGRVPQRGERTLQGAISILLGRVEDYYFAMEASGAPPSEKDVKAMASLVRIARSLPYLWENPLELEQKSYGHPGLKELTFAQRERVTYFFTTVMDDVKKKALAQESEGSK